MCEWVSSIQMADPLNQWRKVHLKEKNRTLQGQPCVGSTCKAVSCECKGFFFGKDLFLLTDTHITMQLRYIRYINISISALGT